MESKFELDESTFCKNCNPEAANPSLVLKVTYENGNTGECRDITPSDMEMLVGFFKGNLSYDLDGIKYPIKPRLSRLRKLLGVEKDEEEK